MSQSIRVIAPSGELRRLIAGVSGSSAEAIASIEVRSAEGSTSSPCSAVTGAHTLTHSVPGTESRGTMKGAFEPGGEVSAFPPIAEYAFLSDCEATALVAPSGNVEWMCLPRMDSPSVFGSILDRDAGSFRIGPADVNVPAARRYIPGTMVLETSWGTRHGLDDRPRRAAASGRGTTRPSDRTPTAARPPTTKPTTCCCAWSRCVNGEVEIKLECEPEFDYGAHRGAAGATAATGYGEGVATLRGIDLELQL